MSLYINMSQFVFFVFLFRILILLAQLIFTIVGATIKQGLPRIGKCYLKSQELPRVDEVSKDRKGFLRIFKGRQRLPKVAKVLPRLAKVAKDRQGFLRMVKGRGMLPKVAKYYKGLSRLPSIAKVF